MAYTKTLIGDITEKGFHDPDTVKLQAVATVCDTNFSDIQSTLTDIAVEATADLVGTMVTGNTETGITVTYQDADNTLDFAVDYGTTAATACVGNDSRLSDARTPTAHNLVDTTGHAVTGLTENHVLRATSATAYAFGTIPASIVSDFGESVADAVGAMVTSNTETGISVSYDDDDNTLDFAIAYGTDANTACQGNDSRLADARTPVDHAHAGVAGDGGTLAGYQLDLSASSTLADVGVAVPADGSGCTVDITVDGGAIDGLTLNAGGTDYQAGDVVTVTGGGGDATATIATVNALTGAVTALGVTATGSGYSAGTGVATTTSSTRAWTATEMSGLTSASTLLEVLQAIHDDIVTA
jgi:hypothetical protein